MSIVFQPLTVRKSLFRKGWILPLLLSTPLQAQTLLLEASTITAMTELWQMPLVSEDTGLAEPVAPGQPTSRMVGEFMPTVSGGLDFVSSFPGIKSLNSSYDPVTWQTENFTPGYQQFIPAFSLPGRFDVGHHSLAETDPALLSTVRLRVSSIEKVWSPSGENWEISAALTDPADERLFKSLSDLTAMSGETLRQAPARHWWLGIRKKF